MRNIFAVRRRGSGASAWNVLFWWTLTLWLLRFWMRLCYKNRRFGMEHIPSSGPFIIAANHQSNFDPVIVGTVTHDRVYHSIARATLFNSTILAWLMERYGVIAIRRGESDTKAIRRAIEVIKQGQGVMIFPEGTRTADGNIGEFQRGLWLLIKKCKVPVVPVGFDGAYDAWKIGTKPKSFGMIEVRAGNAFDGEALVEMGEEEGMRAIRESIVQLHEQCQASIKKRLQ